MSASGKQQKEREIQEAGVSQQPSFAIDTAVF
jgi:hypothetical protein